MKHVRYKIGFLDGGSEQELVKDTCLNTATAGVTQSIPAH